MWTFSFSPRTQLYHRVTSFRGIVATFSVHRSYQMLNIFSKISSRIFRSMTHFCHCTEKNLFRQWSKEKIKNIFFEMTDFRTGILTGISRWNKPKKKTPTVKKIPFRYGAVMPVKYTAQIYQFRVVIFFNPYPWILEKIQNAGPSPSVFCVICINWCA